MGRYNSEWDRMNLSDATTIKGLLKFRYRFDLLLDDGSDRYALDSNSDLCGMSDDVVCLYADLDNLINRANFNEYQSKVLELYMQVYIEDDIAEALKVGMQSINRMIDNMCDVICGLNYQSWKLDYAFWNKKRVTSDYKKCSKCGEFLPMTSEYFGWDITNKRWKSQCKRCIVESKK